MQVLQSAIFRARNDGDDVRIVLPFSRISEIELNRLMGTTSSGMDNIRVQVTDDEISVTEEYFFAYFK